MHLQKPRFYREFSLNIVGCRVKYPARRFLDCTSRWSWRVLPCRTVLPTKQVRFQASNGLSVSASTLGGHIQ